MKLFFLSDLHINHNPLNQKLWEAFLDFCILENPDFILIGGDLCEDVKTFETSLLRFSPLRARKFFVPGNHDLWVQSSENSFEKMTTLQKICQQSQWHWLMNEPYFENHLAFFGSCTWYDYSLLPKDHPFSMEELKQKARGGRRWMDGIKTNFYKDGVRFDDFQLCEFFYSQLEKDLHHPKTIQAKTKILLTHFPFYISMLKYTKTDWDFEYFGAFMGSSRFLSLIEKHQIDWHLCGHLHRKNELNHKNTKVLSAPVGYVKEWENPDMQKRLAKILVTLEV